MLIRERGRVRTRWLDELFTAEILKQERRCPRGRISGTNILARSVAAGRIDHISPIIRGSLRVRCFWCYVNLECRSVIESVTRQ